MSMKRCALKPAPPPGPAALSGGGGCWRAGLSFSEWETESTGLELWSPGRLALPPWMW